MNGENTGNNYIGNTFEVIICGETKIVTEEQLKKIRELLK